jgi:hypothetical protein
MHVNLLSIIKEEFIMTLIIQQGISKITEYRFPFINYFFYRCNYCWALTLANNSFPHVPVLHSEILNQAQMEGDKSKVSEIW